MTQFSRILEKLVRDNVDFVIIGGVAATTHGSSMFTWDLDICYARDRANLEKLAASFGPLHPKLRGAPRRGLNFTLDTDFGELDILGEVAGVGTYEDAKNGAKLQIVFGTSCQVMRH